jgi:hypothetical protein
MAETEAHQFIERWDRKIFPRRTQSEIRVVQRLQKVSAAFMFAAFGPMCVSVAQMRHSDFYFGLTIGILALVTFSFSFWLYAHLREASRLLGYSQFANRKS